MLLSEVSALSFMLYNNNYKLQSCNQLKLVYINACYPTNLYLVSLVGKKKKKAASSSEGWLPVSLFMREND